ncbi:MAG: hypothetical protein WD075_10135 [Rhodospirillales bacterium]
MRNAWIISIVILLGVAGCTGVPPYIDRPYAINRDSVMFPDGPVIKSGTTVTVCYAKSSATPASIRALAEAECGQNGLGAAFVEQTYDICPLLAPIAANFKCFGAVADKSSAGAITSNNGVAGSVIPAFTAPRPAGAGRPVGTIGAADVSTTAKSAPFPTYLFNKGNKTQ